MSPQLYPEMRLWGQDDVLVHGVRARKHARERNDDRYGHAEQSSRYDRLQNRQQNTMR